MFAAIGCTALLIVTLGLMSGYFYRCNKKADRGEMIIEGLEGFRYTL